LDNVKGEHHTAGEDRDAHQDPKDQRLPQSGDGEHTAVRVERHIPRLSRRTDGGRRGLGSAIAWRPTRTERPESEPERGVALDRGASSREHLLSFLD